MKILVLPGDGIGPEITESTLKVLDSVQRKSDITLDLEHEIAGIVDVRVE